jgi:vancomycin permeability regulator SanA
MIRGLFRLIFRLITLALLVLIGTAIWIVYDGLDDQGTHADVAVVPGNGIKRDGTPGPILRDRLDRAIELYDKGEFPLIIVSGATKLGGYDEPAAMSNYLVEHQVPATAVIQDKVGIHTSETGDDVARIMHARGLHSVMVVTNYYHVTRTKLALRHAGIHDIEQAHVGVVRKDDAPMLAREVLALYYYLGRFYLVPATEQAKTEAWVDSQKMKEEAQVDGEKIKDQAEETRDKIHDDLESKRK